ncbi:hypothetical protein, partial [Alistipes dispar]|uniref:hypothetical protein n=1 Tax=Alistipes dispar TaxID=2585119 RepID=UPI003A86B92C
VKWFLISLLRFVVRCCRLARKAQAAGFRDENRKKGAGRLFRTEILPNFTSFASVRCPAAVAVVIGWLRIEKCRKY